MVGMRDLEFRRVLDRENAFRRRNARDQSLGERGLPGAGRPEMMMLRFT